MPERSKDWINQAIKDLKTAEQLIKSESFEWSCFIAQQAAEKAVKAVFQKLNAVTWGHSIFDLLRVLSQEQKILVNEDFLNYARSLDKYYLLTRYPNSFESGSPYEYFTKKEAEDALIYSGKIIEFCKDLLA